MIEAVALLTTVLVQSSLFAFFLVEFVPLRYPKWNCFFGVLAVHIIIGGISTTFLYASALSSVLGLALTIVCFLVCANLSPHKALLRALAYYSILIFCEIVAQLMVSVALRSGTFSLLFATDTRYSAALAVGHCFFVLLFSCLTACMSALYHHFSRLQMQAAVATSVLFFLFHSFTLFGLLRFNPLDDSTDFTLFLSFYSLLIIYIAYMMFGYIRLVAADVQLKADLEQMKTLQQDEYEYLLLAQKSAEEAARLRHDVNNQLQVLGSLVQQDPARAAAMAQALQQKTLQAPPAFFCKNPLANIILTLKADTARSAGLQFSAHADIGAWPLKDEDFCGLLTNLLDNAIRHCGTETDEATGEKRPGRIEFRAGFKQGQYVLRCANTAAPSAESTPAPTVPQAPHDFRQKPARHGYGLRIMQSIVQAYDGTMSIRQEQGQYIVNIILPQRKSDA